MRLTFRERLGQFFRKPTNTGSGSSEPPSVPSLTLAEILRKLRLIEIQSRKSSNVQLAGEYKSRFRGQGMQFADVRAYQYGDDVRHIDWRTSARSQLTYVRTYEEERQLNVIVACDISGSANFGSQQYSKREAAALALATIAFSAIANRDLVGLLLFSDQIETFIPPGRGRRHVLRLLEAILHRPAKSHRTDINLALQTIPHLVKHRSVVVLASDFDGSINRYSLKKLAAKHDLICLALEDPREQLLPNVGLVQVQDPETGEALLLDSSSKQVRKQYAEVRARQRLAMENVFRSTGAAFVPITTDGNPVQQITDFFLRRKRWRR